MGTTDNPLLPDINPTDKLCLSVVLPADSDWLWTLAYVATIPTFERYWTKDPDGISETLRRNWESLVAIPITDAILDAELCIEDTPGSLGECFRLDTSSEAFLFYPNDPFNPLDEGISTLGAQTWKRFADLTPNELPFIGDLIEVLGSSVTGYFPNDVFLTYELFGNITQPFTLLQNVISQFTSFPFATVEIELEGTGHFEIELVNTPLGGSCLLIPEKPESLSELLEIIIDFIDGDGSIPDIWRLVELERDIFAIPPELVATQVQEFDFDTEGSHTVFAVFIPRINDAFPFIFPFGGIREIEACGNLKVVGTQTGTVIDKDNYRLEQHVRDGFLMATEQELYNALVRWQNQRASRWLLGFTPDNFESGIEVTGDEFGTGVKLSTSGGSLGGKPDVNANNQELLYGGAMGVGRGFRDLVGELVTWQGNGVTIANMVERLRQFWEFLLAGEVEDALSVGLTNTLANATDVVTPSVSVVAIANLIYCNGLSKQSLYRYALDVEESGTSDAVDIADFYRVLIDELDTDQLSAWYTEGSSIPDSSYTNAPCYIAPMAQVIYEGENVAPSGLRLASLPPQPTLSAPRRYRVEIEGLMTSDNGSTFDGVYLKPSVGNAVATTPRLNYFNGSGTVQMALLAVPGYQTTGQRVLEFETVSGLVCKPEYFYWINSADGFFNVPPITGSLTIRVIDLGNI